MKPGLGAVLAPPVALAWLASMAWLVGSPAWAQTAEVILRDNEPFVELEFGSLGDLSFGAPAPGIALDASPLQSPTLSRALEQIGNDFTAQSVDAGQNLEIYQIPDGALSGPLQIPGDYTFGGPTVAHPIEQSMAAAIESMSIGQDIQIFEVPNGQIGGAPDIFYDGGPGDSGLYLPDMPDMMTGQLNLPDPLRAQNRPRLCPEPTERVVVLKALPDNFKVRTTHFGIYNANPVRLSIGVEMDGKMAVFEFDAGEFLTFALPVAGQAVGAIRTRDKGEYRQNFAGGAVYGVKMVDKTLVFWELKNGNQ